MAAYAADYICPWVEGHLGQGGYSVVALGEGVVIVTVTFLAGSGAVST